MLSLVTVCMNREAHLRVTLPSWLRLTALDEIIIVDWSSSTSLAPFANLDPRIRILRVENEPAWILSYPYNLGIHHASGDHILKCDADCTPAPAALCQLPAAGHFFAGDWRSGQPLGKACVNGQCLFTKAQWTRVNGYSEVLRRYGRDDIDFYERLIADGHVRHEIDPHALDFVPHANSERIANHPNTDATHPVDAFLRSQPTYHEAYNLVVSAFLPWGPWHPQASFETLDARDRVLRLVRRTELEIPLSEPLRRQAASHALRTVAAQYCSIPPDHLRRLDDEGCRQLIARKLAASAPRAPAARAPSLAS